ncbi:hypothetical protein IHE44_0004980 [Lamprotornis superbus]|uniref:Uncharacterized protein n=1 Tax=Lamprotornis superbus TaxID=245042 RepID=A0A835NR45_9PASS|nr:hypothetical protein IHE44_0004980 [Lamprotornis superbus]
MRNRTVMIPPDSLSSAFMRRANRAKEASEKSCRAPSQISRNKAAPKVWLQRQDILHLSAPRADEHFFVLFSKSADGRVSRGQSSCNKERKDNHGNPNPLMLLLVLALGCNPSTAATASPSVPHVKPSYSFGRTFLGLDKCNACIGTSICKKFFKEEIRSTVPEQAVAEVHRAECWISPSPAWIPVPKCSVDLQSAQHVHLADGLLWVCSSQGRLALQLAPAPTCCSPFTAHLCRAFRDILPGTKLLPFGYSHLASGEAGAMQVPSALPKIAELPLAVGLQLHSALAVGQGCYVSQGRRALLALLQGTAGTGCTPGVQECRATNMPLAKKLRTEGVVTAQLDDES